MMTAKDRAALMAANAYGKSEGADALESFLALPKEWRTSNGPILLVDVSPVSYIAAFRKGRKAAGKNDTALRVEIELAIGAFVRDMVEDVNPVACVLVFDSPVKTFRSFLSDGYKANRTERKKAFDEEKARLNNARLAAVTKMFDYPPPGLNVLRKNGYEADDLIAAFVHALRLLPDGSRATARTRIMIATSDQDMSQLLDFAAVDVLDIDKRRYVTAKSFREKGGYGPELVPAVKAIAGDTSDNIPGIRNVGEVTAVKFLTGGALTPREAALIEEGWEKAEGFYDLVKLPFPGCTLKGCAFDAAKKPLDCVAESDIMPF